MSAKHHLHVAALIPSHLSPSDVIAALHDHDTCLSLQALTIGYEKLPETDPEIKKDQYWYPVGLNPISSYRVTESTTYVPLLGSWGRRATNFPFCFQNTPHGIKTRVDASGVTLRSEFRVISGNEEGGEVDGEGEGIGYADWVLVEDVEVTCSWWLMPFVRGTLERTHMDICKKVIEKVVMQKRQAEIARSAAKGKGRADDGSSSPRNQDGESLPDKIT